MSENDELDDLTKAQKEAFVIDLTIKMVGVANEFLKANRNVHAADSTYVGVMACMNALTTIGFSMLSEEGCDDADEIFDAMVKSLRGRVKAQVAARRAELAARPAGDTPPEELPTDIWS